MKTTTAKPPAGHYAQNDEKLLGLLDIHRGRRCFIVGNGPSLQIGDLDRLVGEITFASNRITLAFDQTPWRPTYYTLCDGVVARDNQELIRSLDLPKIFADFVRPIYHDDPRATFFNTPSSREEARGVAGPDGIVRLPEATDARGCFFTRIGAYFTASPRTTEARSIASLKADPNWPVSWNLLRGARAGYSVVNLGIKIAFWMGIREIYTIGIDHNFALPQKSTGERIGSNEVYISDGERNHFHPEYRKPGESWTMPKLDTMAQEFAYARRVLESAGGVIKNASRFSKLSVWEKVDFDSLF